MIQPKKNSNRTITHSAIAIWGGFVYQGLNAICVVLDMLYRDIDLDYFLNIEGYEDFAILDSAKNVISFHQCKQYSQSHDFSDEFEKMREKRAYWVAQSKCNSDATLYFHCSVEQVFPDDIVGYKYNDNSQFLAADKVIEKIDSLIEAIVSKNDYPGNTTTTKNRLFSMIDNHIVSVDIRAKQKPNTAHQQSINHSISFKTFVKLLSNPADKISKEDKIRTVRFYIRYWFDEREQKRRRLKNNDNYNSINEFKEALCNLDTSQLESTVQRLFPEYDFRGDKFLMNVTSQGLVDSLYNVIAKVNDPIESPSIDWKGKGSSQCPVALNTSQDKEEICYNIISNRSNLPVELFRDYRWIVGDIKERIDDIYAIVPNINQVKENDYAEITKPTKLGLLSIDEKNNGKY